MVRASAENLPKTSQSQSKSQIVLPLEKLMMKRQWRQMIRVALCAVMPHLLSILPSSLSKSVPPHSGQVSFFCRSASPVVVRLLSLSDSRREIADDGL